MKWNKVSINFFRELGVENEKLRRQIEQSIRSADVRIAAEGAELPSPPAEGAELTTPAEKRAELPLPAEKGAELPDSGKTSVDSSGNTTCDGGQTSAEGGQILADGELMAADIGKIVYTGVANQQVATLQSQLQQTIDKLKVFSYQNVSQ